MLSRHDNVNNRIGFDKVYKGCAVVVKRERFEEMSGGKNGISQKIDF